MVMIRSGPSPGVRSRQVPYPPGGPSRPAGVKENPVSPGGPGPARFRVVLGFGSGAAVGDGVPLAVGDGQAPRGLRVRRGGGGQVPGQPRVHRAQPAQLAGTVRQAGQGGQRDSQRDPGGEPGRAARAPASSRSRRAALARAGVRAQQQVQEGPGAELVHVPLQPGGASAPWPGR